MPGSGLDRPLGDVDPEIARALDAERERQEQTLEMIASENFAPLSIMQAQGSVATNKYAEGYPGRRYYGGCEHVDTVERLALDRVRLLFGSRYANVQPHSDAQANAAAYYALLEPGDTMLGLDLAHGGHLTHGMRLTYSGRHYNAVPYHVDASSGLIDMTELESLAVEHRPKVIVAGWSAYPRHLDFAHFRAIADRVGALLMVDMAHFAGLVVAGVHPSPVPYADVVTSTTHKTLGGPRGGFVLTNDEDIAKRIDRAVFPGLQGGPLQHVIAAKAVAFHLASTSEFAERQRRAVAGARIVADCLVRADASAGLRVLTGGTDVHLLLVDLVHSPLTGRDAEDRLAKVGITVNRNAVPNDPRPPMVTSGLRIGTVALATRGFDSEDFAATGAIIAEALEPAISGEALDGLRRRSLALAASRPLYPGLAELATTR